MFDFKAKSLLAVFMPCLLGACAMQTYEPKPIDLEQSASRFESRSLTNASLREFMVAQGYPENNLPPKTWGLPELTLAAFYYHPQIEVARAQWQASQAAEITAAQKPNPALNTNAEHHSKTDGGISPWTLGFSFDIPIETSGKRAARIARAENLSEAARIEVGQAAWQVRRQLRVRYIEYQATLQQAALQVSEADLREQIVTMLHNRLQAGMISDIDLNNARLQLQKTNQMLQAERGKIPGALAALAEAIGLPARALDNVMLDTMPPVPGELPDQTLQRNALLNRLDLLAALARYAAAEAKLQLEIAKQRPDITLSPGYGFDQGDNKWTFGLSMILALLNKNEGPIAEANAQRELEKSKIEELQMHVIGQADQARVGYQAAQDEIAKARKVLVAQQQRTDQFQHQFDAGQIDRLELTSAQLEIIGAEQGLLTATIKAQHALSQIEDVMQRPFDNSLTPSLPPRKDAQP